MSGLDAGFLHFETPTQPMTIGLLALVSAAVGPGATDSSPFFEMRETLAERVAHIPVLRWVPRPVPLGLDHPVWDVVADVDLDRHLHRVAVPSPHGLREVTELVGHLSGLALPRDRPLWEMWFIEGLADGRTAVFAKFHHAMVDGVASADVLGRLCGLDPAHPGGDTTVQAPRRPTDVELVGRGALRALQRPLGLARMLPRTVDGLVRTLGRATRGSAMAAPFRAPRLPVNGAVTGHRTCALATLDLDEMKQVKRCTGASVNDVLLTVCGGALRRYLEERDLLPAESLVASVPISVRESSRRDWGSNKVSVLFVRLGTDVEDHEERLRVVHRGATAAKEHAAALGPDTLHDWAEIGVSPLAGRVRRAHADLRLADRGRVAHNLTVSNIPGPPGVLSFLGAPLEALHPLGPVMDGAGLNITAMSLDGRLHLGLHGCREQIPDAEQLAGHLEQVMTELAARVGARLEV
jgi:diacylglycerol O-acyltransferase / wax synthase